MHRNISVGHTLEVGKIDLSEALADSTVGSFLGLTHGSRLGFRFDQQPTHTTCNSPLIIDDSRVARQLGFIATENGAAESSTLRHEQRDGHDWKSDGPVIGGQRAKTGSTSRTRWRTIQSPAKPQHHVRSPSHEPSNGRPTSLAHAWAASRWIPGSGSTDSCFTAPISGRCCCRPTDLLSSVLNLIILKVPFLQTSASQIHCFRKTFFLNPKSCRGLQHGQLRS